METERLRNLQHPSQTDLLLEALISRGDLLPDYSYRIRDPQALSPALQAIARRAVSAGRIWACWATPQSAVLFTCEMSLHLSRERGTPVLLVDRYSANGELQDSGPWMADAEGNWKKCGN
ncbi:MAG: hypothetical protein JO361_00245 [Gammaproteobacteria bacterium]|nr:hypothetical protein [Gammaproteobacteria bacterium]